MATCFGCGLARPFDAVYAGSRDTAVATAAGNPTCALEETRRSSHSNPNPNPNVNPNPNLNANPDPLSHYMLDTRSAR